MLTNRCIGVRLSPRDIDRVKKRVKSGQFMNCSDFLREAVREKLEREEGKAVRVHA